jgi:hypothetical protein
MTFLIPMYEFNNKDYNNEVPMQEFNAYENEGSNNSFICYINICLVIFAILISLSISIMAIIYFYFF